MENYFCMSIRVIGNYTKKYLNERIISLGLNSFQCGVLNRINHLSNEGVVVFQKNLEDFFVTSKSSMSDLLQSLELKGLISRVSLLNGDSRKKEIKLTKEGLRLAAETDKFLDEVEDFFMSYLNEEEKKELFKIFAKFNERMEKNEC